MPRLCVHHVNPAAAPLGAAGFVDHVAHVARVFNAMERDNATVGRIGVGRTLARCFVASVKHDRADSQHPIDESLPDGDVIDINKQDAIVRLAQNATLDDQPMSGQSIMYR